MTKVVVNLRTWQKVASSVSPSMNCDDLRGKRIVIVALLGRRRRLEVEHATPRGVVAAAAWAHIVAAAAAVAHKLGWVGRPVCATYAVLVRPLHWRLCDSNFKRNCLISRSLVEAVIEMWVVL